ncbi:MAG: L-lactate permease [Anaerolineae bacterium]|nr:L-lactate permease [Anaerolineae bacterium]
MNTILAALPLLVVLTLMMGLRWSGWKAGAAGWVVSLLLALVWFGVGPRALFWAQVQGFFRAVYVLYIIWGALFFFRVTEADGTLRDVSEMLQQLAPGKTLQVLLLAWGFTSFLQGVGGFGVPVAVVAPILVTLGLSPLNSVVIASLGLAWAVSFGSLGASYEALITATGLESATVAPEMAIALSLVCFAVGFIVLRIASDNKPLGKELGPVVTMAAAMSGVQYVAVRLGTENIAAMLGALAGIIVGGIWAVIRRRAESELTTGPLSPKDVIRKMLPYLVLLLVIFAVNFIPFLNTHLNGWVLSFKVPALALADGSSIPAGQTKGISIFGHAGAQLIYAAVIILLIAKARHRLPEGSAQRIRRGIVKSGTKSTLGILTMMAMATTMQIAGMVSELAASMASLAGQSFPIIAPWIGALGAFMTGSNTNSNVLLGAFQLQVAQTLGMTVPLVIALHNAGAAVGSVFSPAKIIVGCSTVGLSGEESEALSRTARYGAIIIGIVAVVGLALSRLL